ncbi:MAG: NAD-dependent nucleoside diphosphate-sugar epimerase/dehydratase [Planctomycetota bacterium]|nr:MAG: NAD-dependent nucleoside diphosphate-sugar epimerase/dehydratase [Planctomycetota bacterium]
MKIAITGGTGFVGRALAAQLEAAGHQTVQLSRRTGVDVQDLVALSKAFAGCDAVAHCAGINRELPGQRYEDVHVRGTRNVVTAAESAGVRRLVLMSFLRARPNCGSGYHESKWAAEEIVRASSIDSTVIKAGVVYGSGDHLLDHLSHALYSFPVFGLVGFRDRPVRPIAVEDLARILAAGATDPRLANTTLPVTGPEQLTLAGVVARVAEVLGKRPVFVRLPIVLHRFMAQVLERTMKIPMISLAQVRILSESLVEPFAGSSGLDAVPDDLRPTQRFDPEAIRRGLPEPGRFGCRDLSFSTCA